MSQQQASKARTNAEQKKSSSTSASQQIKPDNSPAQILSSLQASSFASTTSAMPQVDSPMDEILTMLTAQNKDRNVSSREEKSEQPPKVAPTKAEKLSKEEKSIASADVDGPQQVGVNRQSGSFRDPPDYRLYRLSLGDSPDAGTRLAQFRDAAQKNDTEKLKNMFSRRVAAITYAASQGDSHDGPRISKEMFDMLKILSLVQIKTVQSAIPKTSPAYDAIDAIQADIDKNNMIEDDNLDTSSMSNSGPGSSSSSST